MVLGLVMDALDHVEHRGQDVEAALEALFARVNNSQVPGVVAGYVAHAVRLYLAQLAGAPPLRPVVRWWVVQHVGDNVRELWAWGRRYESADGAMRELRLLRFGEAGAGRRVDAEVAVTAYVAAQGGLAAWPSHWDDRFSVEETRSPERVVVSEVGLVDGSRAVLFEGAAAEAIAWYDRVGRPVVTAMVTGRGTRPGSDCLKCRLLTACRDVPRSPSLLGFRVNGRLPLRQVSISDLRTYHRCPTQYWLRAMHLPRSGEYRSSARLGHAVHQLLEHVHAGARRSCRGSDMPTDVRWASGQWELDDEDGAVGAQMLAHHPQVCPVRSGVTDIQVEPTFVFHDTAAQVLVIAKPDLMYRDGGAWVWRETKTTRHPPDGREVIGSYPQVALATVILAEGLLGEPVDGSRVELELLRPSGADLIAIDPTEPANVARARAVLRELAQPWRADDVFAAAPGRKCRTCPVHRWCPSAADSANDV